MKEIRRDPLLFLVGINILASLLHYGHNMMFFANYPEPAWLSAGKVDLFWFFMTPFALLGYYWHWQGARRKSCFALIAYGLMSLLVLGHYRYAPFFNIPFQIHLFIWTEALCALALMGYVLRLRFDDSSRRATLISG